MYPSAACIEGHLTVSRHLSGQQHPSVKKCLSVKKRPNKSVVSVLSTAAPKRAYERCLKTLARAHKRLSNQSL